jgi:hypothetical protein
VAEWSGIDWKPLGSGLFGGSARALASYGSHLYVAGEFFVAGTWTSSLIARWER